MEIINIAEFISDVEEIHEATIQSQEEKTWKCMIAYKRKNLHQICIHNHYQGDTQSRYLAMEEIPKNFNFKNAPTRNMLVRIHFDLK